MFCARGLRDAEHRNDAAWTGDLDLCDQRLDECFALAVRAGGDDLVDLIGDLDERGGRRHHRFCVELAVKFVAAGRELPRPGLERGEPAREVLGVQGAVLERGQVTVGRRAGPGQLVLGRGQFSAAAILVGCVRVLGSGDSVGDQVVLAAVEAYECVGDCVLDGVGVDPLVAAHFGVVPGAAVAGVVPVRLGLAVRAGAEHGAAACGAADQPGEQVVRPAGRPFRAITGAGGQDPLRLIEGGLLDNWRVAAGGGDPAEGQLTQVDAVGQDTQHLVRRPAPARGGAVPALIQCVRDGAGAGPVPGVKVEDQLHDGCLGPVRYQRLLDGVHLVAERAAAALPLAGGGFAFHPGDHPVDDGVAFELGEHAEHLHEHPAHRGGGVEWPGRRPEHHPGGVEIVEQGDQVAQAAGEPVDPVDQQHVDYPGSGGGERALQARAAGGGARSVVGEPGGLPPAGLGVDVCGQPGVLRLDGVGLVLVVGGPAHIHADPHVTAVTRSRGLLAHAFHERLRCSPRGARGLSCGVVSVARRAGEVKQPGVVRAGPSVPGAGWCCQAVMRMASAVTACSSCWLVIG
jgi:hypothetical protein